MDDPETANLVRRALACLYTRPKMWDESVLQNATELLDGAKGLARTRGRTALMFAIARAETTMHEDLEDAREQLQQILLACGSERMKTPAEMIEEFGLNNLPDE